MTWLHFGHSLLGLLIHFCLLGSEDSGAFFCGKSLAINYPNCPVENTERKK
jgi:CDP-diglyceride synthetase